VVHSTVRHGPFDSLHRHHLATPPRASDAGRRLAFPASPGTRLAADSSFPRHPAPAFRALASRPRCAIPTPRGWVGPL